MKRRKSEAKMPGPEIQGLAEEVVEKCRKYIPPSKVWCPVRESIAKLGLVKVVSCFTVRDC